MKFLLQSEFKNEAFITLQRAQDYHRWKNDGKEIFDIIMSNDSLIDPLRMNWKEWCPIGSVEFVHNYYKDHFELELKPINVPEELFPFAGRLIMNIYSDLEGIKGTYEKLYVKSNDFEKWSQNNVYNILDINNLPKGNYQISEVVDIVSEWRIFVYRNQMLSSHYYSGDSWTYPDLDKIIKMNLAYTNNPSCYTLDIAVINKSFYNDIEHKQDNKLETVILEVHDFYACGLYGFQDLEKLPFMYWRSHLDKINKL